jgi:RNA polymerase sigma-70 factor (ECF subfamily)
VRLAGREVADEVAQECFLRAWLRAAEYRGEGSYPGWLYRIAWRIHIDRQRKSARRDRLALLDAEPEQPHGQAHLLATDAMIDAKIDARRMLATLDDRTRAALILCHGHGWSHGEVAAMLGLPVGTVKSLILRAKARLRATFAEREPA